ncbi:MAG: UDP-N-acetylglucosamine 2-epimerase [Candidatus Falkowbacteria bacterium]
MNKKLKIAYVSGTRADFGLMTPILRAIRKSGKLELQVYATGMHLMPEFGMTINQIKKEFKKVIKIEAIFKSDSMIGTANFTGDFLSKVIKAFIKNKPDLALILGDRPEMLCVAVACLYLKIPTAHVHGGERTSAVDEVARQAITKLSCIHLPATEESAQRIKKMGEEKSRIHIVGAPALDAILNEKLPKRNVLFKRLGINPKQKIILLTQHPVSDEWQKSGKQIKETIAASKRFNLPVVAIYPNADAGGGKIIKELKKEKNNPKFHVFPNLEYKQFLTLEREAAVWIGNSSAAMIESSSFKAPVVNIGTRQSGRQRGKNVINVGYNRDEITAAIKKSLFNKSYLAKLKKVKNPWGDGKTGLRAAKILEKLKLNSKLLNKQITF